MLKICLIHNATRTLIRLACAYAFFLVPFSLAAQIPEPDKTQSPKTIAQHDSSSAPIRVGVLSAAKEPKPNTSQGLFIKILADAGCKAGPISAQQVKSGGLGELDLFIIGGGSGTQFNSSLGEDGGKLVEEFVRNGGGVIGSCAGGYSFVLGHNEALRYIEVANARCIDTKDGRWARGKGTVKILPTGREGAFIEMYYANGPLWEIADQESEVRNGFGRIEALARFESDIHKEGDAGGVMPGTPAILAGTFGKGRFVLFSAHPEFKQALGNYPLVVDAARWATQGPLSDTAKIDWSTVFPSYSLM